MASYQAATVTDILKHNKGVERLNDGQTEKALEVFSELLGNCLLYTSDAADE